MQSDRGGFADEAADIAPGEELEGDKHRDERQVAAGGEARARQPARQPDRRQVAGVQAVRGHGRDEEDPGRGQTRVQGQCAQCQWSG